MKLSEVFKVLEEGKTVTCRGRFLKLAQIGDGFVAVTWWECSKERGFSNSVLIYLNDKCLVVEEENV